MTITRIAAVIVVIAAGVLTRAQSADGEVSYRLRYERPGDPTVVIDMSWARPLAGPTAFVMPRAIPMGYGEQRYDAFVSDVRAVTDSGTASKPERTEGPRWLLPRGTIRVTYRVNLQQMEREVHAASDSSRVRDGYLAVLGYSIFGFVDGFETRAASLHVEGPANWPVFSTLSPRWPLVAGPVDAGAADFYALADGQIVMGPRLSVIRLAEKPVPLFLALYAEGPVDTDRVGRQALTAFQRVAAYFGTTPFTHYTLHQELLTPVSPRHEYGMSMEHFESSTFYLAADTGLTAASSAEDDARVLYNFAHHIAHAWVPKRAYGEGYFPFQWELAPVLDSIWFAEGFGQYAAIVAVAAGTPEPAVFRQNMLARRFQANIATAPPFLKRLSLVELSRVASTRYAEDFRTGRLVFSRGGLMAAAIDDRIRAESKGAKSLRDALIFLIDWSARERRGFAIRELAGLVRQASGVDVSSTIEQWLRPLD